MWNRTPVDRIDVATLRTGRLGDNCCADPRPDLAAYLHALMLTPSLLPPVLPDPSPGSWVTVNTGPVPLLSWWAPTSSVKPATRAVIVLPEIFGLNGWVRGVADRLSAAGVPALAMPLFARTAPELELGYDPDSTSEGRRHKEATSTEEISSDVQVSIDWLRHAPGHAALVAATLVEQPPAWSSALSAGGCFWKQLSLE